MVPTQRDTQTYMGVSRQRVEEHHRLFPGDKGQSIESKVVKVVRDRERSPF